MQCVPKRCPQCSEVHDSIMPSGFKRPTGSWQMGHSSGGSGARARCFCFVSDFLGELVGVVSGWFCCGCCDVEVIVVVVLEEDDESLVLRRVSSFLRSFRLTLGRGLMVGGRVADWRDLGWWW